jgi:predicted permease
MSHFDVLYSVIPVFLLIALGWSFGRLRDLNLAPLSEVIVYLTAPALIFTSLASKPLFPNDMIIILLGVAGIFAGVGLLIIVYSRIYHFRSRGFILPALFMNSGNMGLPLAAFVFGDLGLQRATLFFVIVSLLHNSLGVYLLLTGLTAWKRIFHLPLLYASLLGIFFSLTQTRTPEPLFQPLRMLGQATIPLMLVSLGYHLRCIKTDAWLQASACALIRIFGGFASAYATVTLLDIQGLNRQIILLFGSLPSAVTNFALTEFYNQDPDLAASVIFLSTLLSVVTIPLVLWLIL